MALIKCKECGNKVSNTANSCPHCGAKVPKANGCGCGTMLGVFILGYFVMSVMGNHSDEKVQPSPPIEQSSLPSLKVQDPLPSPKEQALIDYKDACSKNYKVCKDNADIMNLNTEVSVKSVSRCKLAAEEKAISTIDWGGWLTANFSSFIPGDSGIKENKIIAIDNVAMYQNQFGAKIKKKTTCLFNLKTHEAEILLVE